MVIVYLYNTQSSRAVIDFHGTIIATKRGMTDRAVVECSGSLANVAESLVKKFFVVLICPSLLPFFYLLSLLFGESLWKQFKPHTELRAKEMVLVGWNRSTHVYSNNSNTIFLLSLVIRGDKLSYFGG
jgi:hypothetical protein